MDDIAQQTGGEPSSKHHYPDGTASEYSMEIGEEDSAGSLTKQLAETAVGVREMSKQLGMTRVHSIIQSVLIVTKARDNRLIKLTRELALYLMLKKTNGGRGMIVYVDHQLKTSRRFDAAGIQKEYPHLFAPLPRRRDSTTSMSSTSTNGTSDSQSSQPEGQLRYWTPEMCSRSPHLFDFVVTLGGDGTVLFTSWLFQRIVPPVLPFALGSLGFLTNFDFSDHQSVMDNVIDSGIRVNLRMRFTCTVYRAVAPGQCAKRRAVKKGDTGEILMKNLEKGGWEALENGIYPVKDGKPAGRDKEIMCYTTRPVESFEVLNDLVVDRGPSPYVSLLELFGDEHHLTTVQADGLCVATPTGSTAYSLSAGGSLVHPEIPAILITPICPHTLSFRPMLLPDSMELRVCVPFNSRSTAWASFDGRGRVELKQGDHIKITASKYPFPTVCAVSQSTDWFTSISRTLKWNERERQKSFVVVEEGPVQKQKRLKKHHQEIAESDQEQVEENLEDEEEDEVDDEGEEEEEEKFDIDDLSSTESPTSESSQAQAELAARALMQETKRLGGPVRALRSRSKSKGRQRSSSRGGNGNRSGVETPDRFVGPHPHPPPVSSRHVQFLAPSSSSSDSLSPTGEHEAAEVERDATVRAGEQGSRDFIHSPKAMNGTKSRIPKDRGEFVEGENLKTPTLEASSSSRRRAARSRERERGHVSIDDAEPHSRRAFAVWGQDESESESAASDSDV
ncbi:ATP-NAD kinase [Panus rudis PR-1116 ss-1]|nr:ATP-NAD kinase [Panus rudis PR-1116 ss-1]